MGVCGFGGYGRCSGCGGVVDMGVCGCSWNGDVVGKGM